MTIFTIPQLIAHTAGTPLKEFEKVSELDFALRMKIFFFIKFENILTPCRFSLLRVLGNILKTTFKTNLDYE